MKKCSRCKLNLTLDNFSIKNRKTNQLQYHCKACQKLASRKYYENNIELHRARCKKHSKLTEDICQKYIVNYLKNNPCVSCGEVDILCLDFHHINPNDKEFNVSSLVKFSLTTLKLEVEKCIVLCANCHRRETHKSINSYKYKWVISVKDSTEVF